MCARATVCAAQLSVARWIGAAPTCVLHSVVTIVQMAQHSQGNFALCAVRVIQAALKNEQFVHTH
jgi:hypothetical protein